MYRRVAVVGIFAMTTLACLAHPPVPTRAQGTTALNINASASTDVVAAGEGASLANAWEGSAAKRVFGRPTVGGVHVSISPQNAVAQAEPDFPRIDLAAADSALQQAIADYTEAAFGRWVGDCSNPDVDYTTARGGYCAQLLTVDNGWAQANIGRFATDGAGVYEFEEQADGSWQALGENITALSALYATSYDPTAMSCDPAFSTYPGTWESFTPGSVPSVDTPVEVALRNRSGRPGDAVHLNVYVHRGGSSAWFYTSYLSWLNGSQWTTWSFPGGFSSGERLVDGVYSVYWLTDDAQLVACDGFVING